MNAVCQSCGRLNRFDTIAGAKLSERRCHACKTGFLRRATYEETRALKYHGKTTAQFSVSNLLHAKSVLA